MYYLLVGVDEPWDSYLCCWIWIIMEIDSRNVMEFYATRGISSHDLVVL